MYEDWLTIPQAAEKTGISLRSLQRKIESGDLRKEHRPMPGRKPLPILDPVEIEELAKKVLHPTPADEPEPDIMPHDDMAQSLAELAQVLKTFMLSRKPFLTIKEASVFTGLPQTYLREKAQSQEIDNLRRGKYLIARKALLQHCAMIAPSGGIARLPHAATSDSGKAADSPNSSEHARIRNGVNSSAVRAAKAEERDVVMRPPL